MKKTAYIFPGQASQYPGMGKDLYENYPEAKTIFEQADDALGFPLSKYCFEGSKEDLVKTEITQPAILTVSVAAYKVLANKLGYPVAAAGHSLGEYSALVASGALSFTEAVVTVHHRGKYMQEAVPQGEGAMAAIMGMDRETLQDVCLKAGDTGIVNPANFNAPTQIVISGHKSAVEKAVSVCREQGAKKAVLLPVSAPFHCALMEPAAQKLAPELEQLKLERLSFPVLKNVDASSYTSQNEIPKALKLQITHPVLWQDSAENLVEMGTEIMVEVGPGKVLAGLMKRINRSVTMLSIENTESAQKTIDMLMQ